MVPIYSSMSVTLTHFTSMQTGLQFQQSVPPVSDHWPYVLFYNRGNIEAIISFKKILFNVCAVSYTHLTLPTRRTV